VTDRRTDGQNYDSNNGRLTTCAKNERLVDDENLENESDILACLKSGECKGHINNATCTK